MGVAGYPTPGIVLVPVAKAANYTAAPNDYVLCTGSFTVTLPAPVAGSIVGVKSLNGTTAAPVTVSAPGASILGVAPVAATMLLSIPGAFVRLLADGTNWHVIDSTPVEETICKLWASGAQGAPAAATWTQLQFTAALFNYGGFTFAGSPITGVIVPIKGLYRILGAFSTVANTQSIVGALTLNGATGGTGHVWPDGTTAEAYIGATASNGASYPSSIMEQVCELAAGDTIRMEEYQSTGPQPTVAGRVFMIVERLR
jgi:hypothetical protein